MGKGAGGVRQEGWDFKASLFYTVNFEASLGHTGKPCLQRSRERKEGGREGVKEGGSGFLRQVSEKIENSSERGITTTHWEDEFLREFEMLLALFSTNRESLSKEASQD